MSKKLLKKIKSICEDHQASTDINDVSLCENESDHYILGKWDMAQEIMEEIINNKPKGKYGCTTINKRNTRSS